MINYFTVTKDNGFSKTFSAMEIGLRHNTEYSESHIKSALLSLGYNVESIACISQYGGK